jgi:hypothetical protein
LVEFRAGDSGHVRDDPLAVRARDHKLAGHGAGGSSLRGVPVTSRTLADAVASDALRPSVGASSDGAGRGGAGQDLVRQ